MSRFHYEVREGRGFEPLQRSFFGFFFSLEFFFPIASLRHTALLIHSDSLFLDIFAIEFCWSRFPLDLAFQTDEVTLGVMHSSIEVRAASGTVSVNSLAASQVFFPPSRCALSVASTLRGPVDARNWEHRC